MGFEFRKVFLVKCDDCGDYFATDTDMEFECYRTKKELVETAKDCDWDISKNGKCYCQECKYKNNQGKACLDLNEWREQNGEKV